jgi:hypothetical protein
VAARTTPEAALRDLGSIAAEDVRHHGVHPRLPAGGGAQEHVTAS